ncbi:MAG: FkbM family methyltransferase, partial [Pseudomonadota bacterium]
MSAGDLRFPSTQSALARIQSGGLKFETVIDVGVHEGTPKLMKALPNALHLLIEPSAAHANAIAKNYREIPHELIPVAAGKEDGSVWFVDHAIDGGTAITHSRIVSSREEAERTENLRNIAELPVRRLDTIAAERDLAGPIFLKIDVDGKEIDVLEGARGLLGDVSALSIEAPLMHLSERTLWLEEAGFTLYDIVDFDYYKNVLWQVDLVFVAESAIESHPDLVASPNVGPF